MKVLELEDRLESLQNDLLIIYETANALEIPLAEGALNLEQVSLVLVGITKNIRKTAESIGELVEGTMGIRKTLEEL